MAVAGDECLASQQTTRTLVAGLAVIGPRLHLGGQSGPRLGLSFEWRLRKSAGRIDKFLVYHCSSPFAAGEARDAAANVAPAARIMLRRENGRRVFMKGLRVF